MQYKDCKDNSTFAPQALEGNIASWRKRTHGESRTRAHIHEYLEKWEIIHGLDLKLVLYL